jgi:hypothetical protein
MNKYWVSVWNLEKIHANNEDEAVKRITQEFLGGWYSARDFEYDDITLWDGDNNPSLFEAWNLYKNGAPSPHQDIFCPDRTEDGDKEFLVTIIGAVMVEAEDEKQAEIEASNVFPYMSKDSFEIHISN